MCEGADNASKTICDYSGNNNHGIPQGAPEWLEPPQSGILDGAFRFDGVDDAIIVPHSLSINLGSYGQFSVESLITPDSIASPTKMVASKGDIDNHDTRNFVLFFNSETLYFNFTIGEFSALFAAPGLKSHVLGTYSNTGNSRLFVNGVSFGDKPFSGIVPTNNDPLVIGANSNLTRFFDGLIDEISLYDRALSAEEVNEHYLSSSGD